MTVTENSVARLAASTALVRALCRPDAFPHPSDAIRVLETHISWVILTGAYAYKIKKPVALEFVDFSSAEVRIAACLEELRLNQRLAPELYLGVVPITGSRERPVVGGAGPPLEYAVQMREFPEDALGQRELEAGRLRAADLERLAGTLADFHAGLPPASPGTDWGTPERVAGPIRQTLAQLTALLEGTPRAAPARALTQLCERQLAALGEVLVRRRRSGAIRECHGDLHLGNLVHLERGLVPFDALEFDPALRWIDVISEVAFLVMDLCVRGRPDLAYSFLNRYLVQTGDYAGLPLMPLYLSYRAAVRAKVTLLATAQGAKAEADVGQLLDYAAHPLGQDPPQLMVTCGASGSGKTWLARRIAPLIPALHLRSDVERKRLAGLPAEARTDSALGGGIYSAELTARTYERLAELARVGLGAGFSVIVDATCLKRAQRATLLGAGLPAGVTRRLVYLRGRESLLRERVLARLAEGHDASEANETVLAAQLRELEVPTADEADELLVVDAGLPIDPSAVFQGLRGRA